MFWCCSSFKIFASLMTVSKVLSFTEKPFCQQHFRLAFHFGSYFATKTAQNVPCIIIHGQLSFPRKTAANHQAYLFFFYLTSTWVEKGRTLPAALICFPWFFRCLEHLWENLWQVNTIWLSYFSDSFLYPLEIHFPKQNRQRNVEKGVIHVRSCCFVY